MIKLKKEIVGKILDIGGGGEGIIGRLYGEQVVAIDNRQEELDEAPGCYEKILMDATEMAFADNTFDNVTSFYTLMYMNADEQNKALCEAARVLKPGGQMHIWDCNINSAYPEPFCIDIEVLILDHKIQTTYGIGKDDTQSIESMVSMCENAGLRIEATETEGDLFYIKCSKK